MGFQKKHFYMQKEVLIKKIFQNNPKGLYEICKNKLFY